MGDADRELPGECFSTQLHRGSAAADLHIYICREKGNPQGLGAVVDWVLNLPAEERCPKPWSKLNQAFTTFRGSRATILGADSRFGLLFSHTRGLIVPANCAFTATITSINARCTDV